MRRSYRVAPSQGRLLNSLQSHPFLAAADATKLILPSAGHDRQTILPLVLALHRRSNDFAMRAESARVLVNAVRTLFSQKASDPAPSDEVDEAKRALSANDEVAVTLVDLVKSGAEGGYNILVAEGVLGLAILASSDAETGAVLPLSPL